jgi:hypothetical protein
MIFINLQLRDGVIEAKFDFGSIKKEDMDALHTLVYRDEGSQYYNENIYISLLKDGNDVKLKIPVDLANNIYKEAQAQINMGAQS